MRLISRSRPSPALLVAVLALVVALGGTAIAAPDFATTAVGKKQIKKIAKKQGKKQAKKQIRKKAPGLSVNHANTADRATEADHATNADNATNATNATNAQNAQNATNAVNGAPRAFARVLAAGGVDEPRTKGITDAGATLVGTVYCFELGFTPRQVQATVDWFAGGGDAVIHATVNPPNNFALCPAGNDGSARIVDASTGLATTRNFYISFDE